MRLFKSSLLLLCATTSLHNVAQAKPKPTSSQARHTVLDYFLRLGTADKDYVFGSPRNLLHTHLIVKDIARDYIETSGDGGQPYLQTAVFRYHGTELFAVNAGFEEGTTLKFYRWGVKSLKDVTSQVWKMKLRSGDFGGDSVVLPRYGTNIVVWDENKKVRATFLWRGGRFVRS